MLLISTQLLLQIRGLTYNISAKKLEGDEKIKIPPTRKNTCGCRAGRELLNKIKIPEG